MTVSAMALRDAFWERFSLAQLSADELRSGDRDRVHRAGASVRGRVIAADYVHPDGMEEHIIHWVDENDDI